jgi:magnesium chelatase family protein
MMASRLPTILPTLTEDERIESALIHSVAGLPFDQILAGVRPFRAPHHGASRAGMVGGGNPVQPGEVSFAHSGVLFLDELPEFSPSVLQLLRQPMEQRFVSLARVHGTVVFPAHFMLVAAANPCPCGYYNDPKRSCSCTPAQIARYQGRIGGPLMDRIEIIVDIWRSDPGHVLDTGKGTSSAQLREGVLKARAFAQWRRSKDEVLESIHVTPTAMIKPESSGDGDTTNMDQDPSTSFKSNGAALLAACKLSAKERSFLEIMAERYQLSGRGIMCTLSVARTIADMEESDKVKQEHLLEAVSFRKKDMETVSV